MERGFGGSAPRAPYPVRIPRRRRAVWAALSGAAILVLFQSRAAAEPSARVELTWQAPAGCPGRDEILAKARTLMGGHGTRSVSAVGRIEPRPSGFELVLSAQGTDVELRRRLDGGSCQELGDAAALILAMAARPELPQSRESAAPASPAPAAPPSPSRVEARRKPLDSAPRPPRVAKGEADRGATARSNRAARFDFLAGSLVDAGSLPAPTLHLVGGVGLRGDAGGVEGQFRYWLERDREVVPGKGGELALAAGALLGCLAGPPRAAVCAGAELGQLRGRGYGTDNDETRRVVWVAGILSGRMVAIQSRWLRMGGLVEVGVPVRQYEFLLEGLAPVVHRPWVLCPRAGVWGSISLGGPR